MCNCQKKAYYVTLEVPVQVTCRVQAAVWIAYRGGAA